MWNKNKGWKKEMGKSKWEEKLKSIYSVWNIKLPETKCQIYIPRFSHFPSYISQCWKYKRRHIHMMAMVSLWLESKKKEKEK